MPEQDPLAQLRNLHLPEPISLWPPAPGWWLLAILLLIAISAGAFLLIRQYRKNRYRRLALLKLADIEQTHQQGDVSAYIQQLNQLLKQTASAGQGDSHVSALTGQAWLDYLDQSGKTNQFNHGAGKILLDGPYRLHIENTELGDLQQLAQQWIKGHRIQC